MSTKCEQCGAELEQNAKFCTSCGEKVSEETTIQEKSNDLPKKYLFISFLIGIIPSILGFRTHYNLEDINLSYILTNGTPEIYGEIIGGALGFIFFPVIIIGFIWGIKSLMSKKYQKPILHIFIGTIIVSVMMTLKYLN